VLALSTADALAPAHALALLARGGDRSRRGDMLLGQPDLLRACEMLKSARIERDHELCLATLANHFKAIDDLDEALPLYVQLREQARARGARFDESIYAYGIAEVHFHRAEWAPALSSFQATAAMARALSDPSGLAYSEAAIAATLRNMGDPAAALPHVDQALHLLDEGADPAQSLRSRLVRARVLAALGRSA